MLGLQQKFKALYVRKKIQDRILDAFFSVPRHYHFINDFPARGLLAGLADNSRRLCHGNGLDLIFH
jgi:hypothetical protein